MQNFMHPSKQQRSIPILPGGNGGYTLIELMVTMVVFIALSVLAVPSIRAMVDNMSGNRAAHELIADLNVAKTLAIRHGLNSQVAFNVPALDQYTITWTDDNGLQNRVVDLSGFRSGIRFEPNPPSLGVNSPAPVATIVFTPRGFTTPAGMGSVYLTDQDVSEVVQVEVLFSGSISEMRWIEDNNQWIYK